MLIVEPLLKADRTRPPQIQQLQTDQAQSRITSQVQRPTVMVLHQLQVLELFQRVPELQLVDQGLQLERCVAHQTHCWLNNWSMQELQRSPCRSRTGSAARAV